ncbi:D-glycero-beta-D-manno-heptose 1-phosphate adenylyltransferase [Hyphomonas sp.]|uniref:D-glycero-beta-D-manno-heptose 1-phosphate adenylyltransferase n=1 Tax=Hyphomonas sp. TaxID=87 RepID=UPI00391C47C3
MSSSLAEILARASGKRVIVVGDVMLDRFVYGDVARVSPEAPVPVLRYNRQAAMPGGAANVARNVASLGLAPVLIGVCGDDEPGTELAHVLSAEAGVIAFLEVAPGRPTTVKTRFVAGGHQLLRLDAEDARPLDAETADRIIARAREALGAGAAVLLLSDYSKGLLTDRVLADVTDLARSAGVPVIADPKGRDFSRYGAVDLIKPNASELAAAIGLPVGDNVEAERALSAALEAFPARAIVVTRAARGMSLLERGGAVRHQAGRAREVYDVSGAGDTSLAALAAGLAGGGSLDDAAALAIAASGIAVGKSGTATVTAAEIAASLSEGAGAAKPGLQTLDALVGQVERWRAAGLRIGFTNGCFDILHPGHIRVFQEARARCDRLIVGLNSDASVRRLKGQGRPVNTADSRAAVLSALGAVDAVAVFEEDTPIRLIEALTPDLLVKGGDYTRDTIVGADLVEARGGDVLIVPTLQGHSTTATIARSGKSGA